MTWERVPATKEYSERLLRIRLEHYVKFQFGVMAVLDTQGDLVGQAGLQVLEDPKLDRVEVVVFLKASVIGGGLGTTLCQYYIHEAEKCGLAYIYATVRPENTAARKLVSKLGFILVDHIVHYGKYCDLWQLRLSNRC
jgi:RimJ/RimL family protein N-acetyltransferase